MALDGLTLYGITKELSGALTGAKIDRISQAENDEILLSLRAQNQNRKLLLSANSSNPGIYFVEQYKKENPLKAPTFLMILRKHLQGGRILSVSQEGLERILRIDIDTLDDMKFQKTKTLIVEIMGRHSNIILIDKESGKILDSIKRIPITVSSVREVLPGKDYQLPPSQGKADPLQLEREEFFSLIRSKTTPLHKAIYGSYSGISPVLAKEICHRAQIDPDLNAETLPLNLAEKLYLVMERILNQVKADIFHPCIIVDKRLDKYIDFSLIHLTLYDFLTIEELPSISLACENFYRGRDAKDRMIQKSAGLKKLISTKLERLENKLGKQLFELQETEKMDEYRKQADILTANMYRLQKGMDEILATDFYDEESPEIRIALDPMKSPSENIQSFYKKYNKLRNRRTELTHQTASAKEEILYLQNVILSIEEAETAAELEEIRGELYASGYVKARGQGKKQKEAPLSSPLLFYSSDGTEILVGKNNRQNDHLTLKTASPDNIWLHTKDIPGSHVVIRAHADQISDMTLVEAATLAAYYSKARLSSKAAVDYTRRKNVRKPSGAKPGMVIYEQHSTLYVNPAEKIVTELKHNSPKTDKEE